MLDQNGNLKGENTMVDDNDNLKDENIGSSNSLRPYSTSGN